MQHSKICSKRGQNHLYQSGKYTKDTLATLVNFENFGMGYDLVGCTNCTEKNHAQNLTQLLPKNLNALAFQIPGLNILY